MRPPPSLPGNDMLPIRQMIDRADRMLDWDYMVHAIERAAPNHEPGRRTGYHGLTYGFLGGDTLQRLADTAENLTGLLRTVARSLGVDFDLGSPMAAEQRGDPAPRWIRWGLGSRREAVLEKSRRPPRAAPVREQAERVL